MQGAILQNSVARLFCTTDVEINISRAKQRVTIRRVPATIIAVQKQELLHNPSVCDYLINDTIVGNNFF